MKVEDCFRISTADLPDPGAADRVLASGVHISRGNTGTAVIQFGEAKSQRLAVRIISRQAPNGPYSLFECPLSGVACRTLFLRDGVLGSRAALGLKYRSQSTSPGQRALRTADKLLVKAERQRTSTDVATGLVEKLEKTRSILRNHGEDELPCLLAIEDLKERLAAKQRRHRPRPSDLTTTRAALVAGRKHPHAKSSYAIGLDLGPVAMARQAPSHGAPYPPSASLAHFPELDIRDLPSGQGHAQGRSLFWDRCVTPWFAHTWLDAEQGKLIVQMRNSDNEVERVQVISIVEGSRRGDRFLICPVTRRRHLRLYYRGSFFAGREVQALLRRSEWLRKIGLNAPGLANNYIRKNSGSECDR